MMIGHVFGPYWYIYRVPGLSNMTIVTIFLDPTCQIWSQICQISQIVQNHDFMRKIEFFSPTTQVRIENMHAWFEMICTMLLGVKNTHFWPINSLILAKKEYF